MTLGEMMEYIQKNGIDITLAMFNNDIGFGFVPVKTIPLRRGEEMIMRTVIPQVPGISAETEYMDAVVGNDYEGETLFKHAIKHPKRLKTVMMFFQDEFTGLHVYADTEEERDKEMYDLLVKHFLECAEIDSIEKLEEIMNRAIDLFEEERASNSVNTSLQYY